jgi:4'-phosphopantetheinyl transferase
MNVTRGPAPVLAGLPAGIVDTWRVPLRPESAALARWKATLNEEERTHAARMRVAGSAWAGARGALRVILAHYLGVAAVSLEFERSLLGKPRLAGRVTPHFSVAWREDMALVGVASDRALGVDLERERDDADVGTLARDHLSPLEQAAIVHAPPEEQRSAFFAAWTRHEARRKLHGLALEDPLPALARDTVVIVRALEVPSGWAAAVAAEGSGWRVRVREAIEIA